MNRTLLTAAGVLGASGPLLVDSAVKGAALLALAALAAMSLKRDSAATRHLVWLLAIVAMLLVPVLSAMLPQLRVLPAWASFSQATVAAAASPPSVSRPATGNFESRPTVAPVILERTSATPSQSPPVLPASRPAFATGSDPQAPAIWSLRLLNALPIVWAIGFSALVLRLLAARVMLWNTERQAIAICSSRQSAKATTDPLVIALEEACLQLAITRQVTLLIYPGKTIPVVWGVLRCRLLLPAAARHWSGEQLQSVLLHELAHIKRRDTIAQLLAQFACALHLFNPLVWFAAWRLSVERERSCDDLVLASGVRPSAYAGHLLEVVTASAPIRWMQSCGLAMARKSSLEARIGAVLSQNLNRRGVSVALAALVLAVAVGIAVPVAMLRAADEDPAEKPKPATIGVKPTEGAKLKPGMEENLMWGEPVNGLRAALVIRTASDKPQAGDLPDLYLAVQNASKAPIRFSDADVPPTVNLRVLYLKIDGEIKCGLGAREPKLGDLMLPPGEVAFLPMFDPDTKLTVPADPTLDKHTVGSHLAESALKDAHQSLFANLEIEKAPAGAWTGKLVTGETTGSVAAGQPQPKQKEAKLLYRVWQYHARENGNVPGGLIARLGEKVKEFIRNNTGDQAGDPYAKKMAPLVPRLDASRDWTPAEVVALMDDIAAVSPIPLETTMEESGERTFNRGAPLPPELANAPWSQTQPSGLRMAWRLEPRAAEHRLGTPLKSRILIHNAGKDVVVFRTRSWHQVVPTARDANGADIKVDSVSWTTIGRLTAFRLWPGEFVEVIGAGIGVGANKNDEDWQNTRVGSWIDAKAGDEVTVTTGPVPLYDWNEKLPKSGEPGWWLDFIHAHLAQDLPLPVDAAERKHLVYLAGMELFGTPLSAEEIAAFVSDREPTALDTLAKRLAQRPGTTPFAGDLTSGPTKFRVLPADPDAAKKPRTANSPGQYALGGNATFVVVRRLIGERIVNEAHIAFSPPDASKPAPREPHEIKLPDGYGTWAAAWMRGGTVLWVQQKGIMRVYNVTDPAQVKESTLEDPANLDKVPKPVVEALRTALVVPAAAKPRSPAPAAPATPKP